MKQLITQIEISASPEKVWQVLTDFNGYKTWNPFIKDLAGKVAVGNRIEVMLQPEGGKPMKFTPIVGSFDAPKKFSWKGKLWIGGIFDGEHIFEVEGKAPGKTLFTQREIFSGILIPFLGGMIDGPTRKGFEAMNARVKERAESVRKIVVRLCTNA